MVDPIMMAVATVLAGKAADALAAGVRGSWSALVRLVRGRLAADPRSEALAVVESGPRGDTEIGALARRLGELAVADPRFDAELRRLRAEVNAGPPASGGNRDSVVNQNSGTVYGPVVQTGEIRGGVHFSGFASPGR